MIDRAFSGGISQPDPLNRGMRQSEYPSLCGRRQHVAPLDVLVSVRTADMLTTYRRLAEAGEFDGAQARPDAAREDRAIRLDLGTLSLAANKRLLGALGDHEIPPTSTRCSWSGLHITGVRRSHVQTSCSVSSEPKTSRTELHTRDNAMTLLKPARSQGRNRW